MPQRVPGPGGIPGDGRPRWQGPRGEGGPQTPRGDGRGSRGREASPSDSPARNSQPGNAVEERPLVP
jgi:hypothetical protein